MKTIELAVIIGNIDEKYVEEAYFTNSHRFRIRRALLAAAVVFLMTVLSAAAFAEDWFGMRSILIRSAETDSITLAGYVDTPEFKAAAEWHDFLASYDVMEAAGNSNGVFAPGTKYNFYQVYNQEMADKLDEIAGKYNLKLHSMMNTDIYNEEELCELVGGDFLGKNNRIGSAYMYEDGTFRFDGKAQPEEKCVLEYQFMRSVKGSMNEITLNIGDMEQYTEWGFVTDEGIEVTLAAGPHRSLVITELEDCMVTIVALAGRETPLEEIESEAALDAGMVELFAEGFDFSVLSPIYID